MLPPDFKIDVHKVRYAVVREALQRFQRPQTSDDPEALLIWWDGFLSNEQFVEFPTYQRINKIPGMDMICYKNTFFQALVRMRGLYPQFYSFFATTFQLPFQYSEFYREHLRLSSSGSSTTWIVKPRTGCCGKGIRLIQDSVDMADQRDQSVVQRYVSPFLLDGYKFDFRFYLLISNLHPLTAFMYDEGLARFCSHPYSAPTPETLDDKFSHLTNTAINVGNRENQRKLLELASSVLRKIADIDEKGKFLWTRIKQIAALSIMAVYPGILQNLTVFSPPLKVEPQNSKAKDAPKPPGPQIPELNRYFHILGIDIMLNDVCDPIVLELNDRPSMCVTFDIERGLKSRIVLDALNMLSPDGRVPDPKAKLGGWQDRKSVV
jgi:hypothetical protein